MVEKKHYGVELSGSAFQGCFRMVATLSGSVSNLTFLNHASLG